MARSHNLPGPDPDFPWLTEEERIDFPDPCSGPHMAPLAKGGNLSPGMLLSAYRQGIFPWFSEHDPLLWWSPDPRFVIRTKDVHISQSMAKVLRQRQFSITWDSCFEQVITACSQAERPGQDGTWITRDIVKAYTEFHRLGHAHSVEVWQKGELVGGLYGVSVGAVFCGESMFSHVSNASKAAFLTVAPILGELGIELIDSQVHTNLFESLGATHIPRTEYIAHLMANRDRPILHGTWNGRFPTVLER